MVRHPLGVHGATMTHVVDHRLTSRVQQQTARCRGSRSRIAAPIQGLQDEVPQLDLPVLDGAAKRRGLAAVFLTVAVKRVEAFAHLGLEAGDLFAEGVDGSRCASILTSASLTRPARAPTAANTAR